MVDRQDGRARRVLLKSLPNGPFRQRGDLAIVCRQIPSRLLTFEQIGVDQLFIDEAHEFKKPPIATKMKLKGLQTQTSNRSIALMFLTKYVRANNNGANVHLFTGTPITNTMTEVFHMMRYMMQEEMKDVALADWDGWFGSFARAAPNVTGSPSKRAKMRSGEAAAWSRNRSMKPAGWNGMRVAVCLRKDGAAARR